MFLAVQTAGKKNTKQNNNKNNRPTKKKKKRMDLAAQICVKNRIDKEVLLV